MGKAGQTIWPDKTFKKLSQSVVHASVYLHAVHKGMRFPVSKPPFPIQNAQYFLESFIRFSQMMHSYCAGKFPEFDGREMVSNLFSLYMHQNLKSAYEIRFYRKCCFFRVSV